MKTFTVFIVQANGHGTTYITGAQGRTINSAKNKALAECARDWKESKGNLRVLGVVEGDVRILEWDDDY
jgi:hypothetical protein